MFGCLRWGSADAFGSAFLGLSLWELCFSLVPPFMGVMLFPSLWLGNASGKGGGGGGGACFAPHSSLSFRLPPPLLYLSSSLFFSSFLSGSTAFSSASSSFSLFCPHLFFLFSSFLPSFHYVFLLCLPSPSSFFEINHFLFHPPLFLLLK